MPTQPHTTMHQQQQRGMAPSAQPIDSHLLMQNAQLLHQMQQQHQPSPYPPYTPNGHPPATPHQQVPTLNVSKQAPDFAISCETVTRIGKRIHLSTSNVVVDLGTIITC